MKITTSTGNMTLDDDAVPSTDDMNGIISSLTRSNDDGAQFHALCEASCGFPDGLTNAQFEAACKEWTATQE